MKHGTNTDDGEVGIPSLDVVPLRSVDPECVNSSSAAVGHFGVVATGGRFLTKSPREPRHKGYVQRHTLYASGGSFLTAKQCLQSRRSVVDHEIYKELHESPDTGTRAEAAPFDMVTDEPTEGPEIYLFPSRI